MLAMTFFIFVFFMKFDVLGSGIMKLGSEGVYLHEKCGTNPSRHLPGPKTNVENKNADFGVSGVSGEGHGTTGFQLPPVGGSWIPSAAPGK